MIIWKTAMIIVVCCAALCFLYMLMIMPRIVGRPKRKPYLGVYYAHRGLHDNRTDAPENSMPAFRKAVESGYGIEMDGFVPLSGRAKNAGRISRRLLHRIF